MLRHVTSLPHCFCICWSLRCTLTLTSLLYPWPVEVRLTDHWSILFPVGTQSSSTSMTISVVPAATSFQSISFAHVFNRLSTVSVLPTTSVSLLCPSRASFDQPDMSCLFSTHMSCLPFLNIQICSIAASCALSILRFRSHVQYDISCIPP